MSDAMQQMAVIPCFPAKNAFFVPVVLTHAPAGVHNCAGIGNHPDMTNFSLAVVEKGEIPELRL